MIFGVAKSENFSFIVSESKFMDSLEYLIEEAGKSGEALKLSDLAPWKSSEFRSGFNPRNPLAFIPLSKLSWLTVPQQVDSLALARFPS
jgi:hypothetical protein